MRTIDCSWADDMESWLQLHGLWRLVSGLERKPAGRAEVRDTAGNAVTPAVDVDEDKLERWETKAEKAAGVLSSRFHPHPSLWPTSMMSWLLWPSLERFPTPSMTLYAPSQS